MLLGAGLWAGGEFTKEKYPRYAQGLLGGGSLAMFFSIYAGYSFYDLYSQAATFIVLVEIFMFLTMQNTHFFSKKEFDFLLSPEQLSLSGIWMLYAIVLFTLGLKKYNRYLRFGGLGLIGIVITKAFFVDLAGLATVYKIVLFIILGLCLLGVSFVYQKQKDIIIGQDNGEEM
ncbi:DUF2339 domain-containing protein [Metallumcola ferriviriculae]|uniref:DUF2339 domain-containing protein n=1 Tax=Metallumcola ferriviriculae TaxID=3039180 RepID=A0AAU0ULS9_9FIRM|nr:DUF2339 domain-containing protein [Desulfitibacteraceae bacterium MK1]